MSTGDRSQHADVGAPMEELDARECLVLLRQTDVGRIAVIVDGRPEIFPVNYVVDHGTVVFRTAPGTKLTAIAVGRPQVAFEVDGYDPRRGEAWSVVLKGHATEITGVRAVFDAAELPLFPWHLGPKHHFVRVAPDSTTGRRFRVASPRGRSKGHRPADRRAAEE